MRIRISTAVLVLTVAALFAGCGGSSSDPGPQPVTIDFKALVGTQPFSCADTAGYAIGTGTLPWIPKDFRFYVSNVRLVDAAGVEAPVTLDASAWQGYGVDAARLRGRHRRTARVGTLETNTPSPAPSRPAPTSASSSTWACRPPRTT